MNRKHFKENQFDEFVVTVIERSIHSSSSKAIEQRLIFNSQMFKMIL